MRDQGTAAARLSGLIGSIYDCVLDPAVWHPTIDRLRQELGFCYAVLGVYPLPSGQVTLGVSAGIDDAKLAELAGYGEDIVRLWGGDARVARFPLEEPIVQSEAVSPAALAISRYYHDWARPQGVIDAVAIGLERSRRMVSTMSFGRHEREGPVRPGDIDLLRLLAPHLRRAISICQLLEMKSVTASNVTAVLDTLPTAILVVDELMFLLHANAAGDALLTAGDMVRVGDGRVTVRGSGRAIDEAVAQAAHDMGGPGRRGGRGIAVRGPDGAARVVHVLPLERRQGGTCLFRRATAALFVTDGDRDLDLPREAFAALYGLTPAETRIAEMIVAGSSQGRIARDLGLKPSTVKTHLLHVFGKTGVRRQADLMRLVASLAGPVAIDRRLHSEGVDLPISRQPVAETVSGTKR